MDPRGIVLGALGMTAWPWRLWVATCLVGGGALLSGTAVALETDQYYAWTRPIADSTVVINAKMDLEITRALEELNRRMAPASCDDVEKAVRGRLEMEIFQPIEMWVLQSPLVDRVPALGEESRRYFGASIYRRHGPLDIGMWIPPSPTLEVAGVRFGSDKLAHFASSGWKYRNAYRRRLERGMSEAEAEAAAIRWGILEEGSINGRLSTGIFSRADMEANYRGMRFYLELCRGLDPLVELRGGQWRLRRHFDITALVTPEWDESYQASIYSSWRWRKVRSELVRHCARLGDPAVQRRFSFYRSIDGTTPTERVVDRLVAAGRLADPDPFSIEALCPAVETRERAVAVVRAPGASAGGSEAVVLESILEEERDRERRLFTFWGLGWSVPRGASGSLGWLSASVPRTTDCRELCDLRGVFGELLMGHTGGQVSLGYLRAIVDGGDSGHVLSNVYLAFGGRVSLLRTWGNSPLDGRRRTLVGLEGVFTITRVNFTMGVFTRVPGDGREWVMTGGIGFGL